MTAVPCACQRCHAYVTDRGLCKICTGSGCSDTTPRCDGTKGMVQAPAMTPTQWGRHICACEHCEARSRGEHGPTLEKELNCKASQIADAIDASNEYSNDAARKREAAARVEGRLQIAKYVGGIQLRLAASRVERYPGYSPRDLSILLETIEQVYAQGTG